MHAYFICETCLHNCGICDRDCDKTTALQLTGAHLRGVNYSIIFAKYRIMDLEKEIFDDAEEALPDEFQGMTADDILRRNRLLENEIRVLKDESQRLTLDQQSMKEKIKENKEKIKLNNQLPYLVGNVVEILDIKPEEEDEEDGANIDLDSQRKGKCVVLKTSTR